MPMINTQYLTSYVADLKAAIQAVCYANAVFQQASPATFDASHKACQDAGLAYTDALTALAMYTKAVVEAAEQQVADAAG